MSVIKILSVDDDPDIRAVIQICLSFEDGLELRLCGSGAEALEQARAYRPDLILLDRVMPDMDGPATLAALRSLPECAATPVVFLTAKAQPGEMLELLALGAVDIIAKPFDPMGLGEQIRAIWAAHKPKPRG
ncbi:MAG: response regulator [Gammaproteobacteria bacterium]|nr:response regulator [Gammaproteobacteria bacterium]